jgi:hypothetical protein
VSTFGGVARTCAMVERVPVSRSHVGRGHERWTTPRVLKRQISNTPTEITAAPILVGEPPPAGIPSAVSARIAPSPSLSAPVASRSMSSPTSASDYPTVPDPEGRGFPPTLLPNAIATRVFCRVLAVNRRIPMTRSFPLVNTRIPVCPRQDSNLRTRLRRPMLYPLSYEGGPTQASGWWCDGTGERRPSAAE